MSEKQAQENQFAIQKLYVKDISFESPGAPGAFSFKKWEPKIDINLNNAHNIISENVYEAVLTITATVKQDGKAAFLVEVQQAGIFTVAGFKEQDRNYILASQCMNILFPYAREVISDLTARGGFPPFILSPVNFDALYQQHVQRQKEKQQETEDLKH
jgi:preprotein translocase subunit SecB